MESTICALASGQGGAVSLVRLSGPDALVITHTLISKTVLLEPRHQTFCRIYDGKSVLDKALVTYFKAPHSFTGEEVIEFALHASPYITEEYWNYCVRQELYPHDGGNSHNELS